MSATTDSASVGREGDAGPDSHGAVIRDGARLAALRELDLLDAGPNETLDRFTRLATELLGVPVSLVSLVDDDRQYFASETGLPRNWAEARQTPLSHSFCQYAVSSGKPLIIDDARGHELVGDNLAVRDIGVVAYAGIPLILADGNAAGAFCAIDGKPRAWSERDISILEDLAAAVKIELDLRTALAAQTLDDQLTKLPNRLLLNSHAERLVDASGGGASGDVAAICVGIDEFGQINEALGTSLGDEVLVEIARTLAAATRKLDLLGRLGGDVFCVLSDEIEGEDEALHIAGRLREAVAEHAIEIGDRDIHLTATVGVALAEPGSAGADLVARAHEAMRDSKNRVGPTRVAGNGLAGVAAARLQLRGELKGALRREEISVEFQSIVSLEDERPIAFEALARWTHPDLGRVSPADFIPIAEQSGEIVPIGEHVLRESARSLARWRAQTGKDVLVTVNVAPVQLEQTNFAEVVAAILEEEGLPGSALVLEITEGTMLSGIPLHNRTLQSLRDQGIWIAIDDFGTGYSALSYFKRFRIDTLKIDRSFVADMKEDNFDSALVQAFLAIGRGLDVYVIAEGIETREQAELLRDLGCKYAQGFLFARPRPPSEIDLELARGGPAGR